ncbi:MAG: flippase activity-associated protein Agl23 [Haloarculaceae archaeon]
MSRGSDWSVAALDARRAVVAVTVVAVLSRLVALGARPVHWDEARVGYWILRSAATGDWAYHPIIHGPFVQHADRFVFALLGANPFTLRLPVALVGGLLPLAALLFRTRLDDAETVALAVVLAANPVLLYYSRFLRSDVPLAAFTFVALGAAIQWFDTNRPRWLVVAAASLALAATTKENVFLYLLAWAGGAGLVLARSVVADAAAADWQPGPPAESLLARARRLAGRLRRARVHLVAAAVLAGAILVLCYAPRSGTPGELGLWRAVSHPDRLPALVRTATLDSWSKLADLWLSESLREHSYLLYAGYYLLVLAVGAAATVAAALVGVGDGRGRPLVAFCGWWGLASLVGYPYVADILAPWLAVHVVIALAVPAAVGLAAVARAASVAAAVDDRRTRAAFLGLLAVSGLFVAGAAGTTSYVSPPHETSVLAQGAQPGTDLNPTMRAAAAAARADADGPDVLYVGRLAVANESANDDFAAAPNWYHRLPLPWYTEAAGLDVASVREPAGIGADPPPVVIAPVGRREAVAARLSGYRAHRESLFLWDRNRTLSALWVRHELTARSVVIFIARDDLRTDSD